MNSLVKSFAAGAASAVGTHYGDLAVNATPQTPTVYYGVALGAGLATVLLRKRPIVAGLLGGIAVGSAYQGYSRTSASGGVPTFVRNLLGEQAALPDNWKGAIPITRKSATDKLNAANAAAGGPGGNSRYIVDSRAFNMKIAPYGVSSTDPSIGVPLKAPWPYGLDADRFAKAPPAAAPAKQSPSPQQVIQQAQNQATGIFDQIKQYTGLGDASSGPSYDTSLPMGGADDTYDY